MARTLFAVDELCGFLVACALVRPSRSLQDLEVASVRKKLKDKAFARGVSREDVLQGATELGMPLEELIAFVLEALRLYSSVATLGREALEPDEIAGYPIPRGAIVVMSQWVVHRDARHYPDPERFYFVRWTPEFRRQLPRLAYFPFGGGQRVCIGEAFAMLEARLALAVLLAHHRVHLYYNPTL